MPGFGGIGPGFALLALAALAVWIVILVWLAGWIIARLRHRNGWDALDWRTVLIPFVSLTAAIHLGNYLLDLVDRAVSGGSGELPLRFPSAFLIGSVAIGVGIAAIRSRRG